MFRRQSRASGLGGCAEPVPVTRMSTSYLAISLHPFYIYPFYMCNNNTANGFRSLVPIRTKWPNFDILGPRVKRQLCGRAPKTAYEFYNKVTCETTQASLTSPLKFYRYPHVCVRHYCQFTVKVTSQSTRNASLVCGICDDIILGSDILLSWSDTQGDYGFFFLGTAA